MKNIILFRIFVGLIIIPNVYANTFDEVILTMCHIDGSLLYTSCILIPVSTPQQGAACTALKAKYVACLAQLTLPGVLNKSLDPDPYSISPWTPCEFETSRLVLPEICISL